MRKVLLFTVVAALFSAPVLGAGSYGQSTRYGVGRRPCSTFTSMAASRFKYSVYEQWTAGFITAYDIFLRNTTNIISNIEFPGAMSWLKQFCAQHPSTSFSTAAAVLMRKLHRQQQSPGAG